MPKIDRKPIVQSSGTAEQPPSTTGNGQKRDYLPIYQDFGIQFGRIDNQGEAEAEQCPFCGKDRFHVQAQTGLYHCKHCQQGGNITDFLTWVHKDRLERTTDEHYRRLMYKRNIHSGTLRTHQLAFEEEEQRWLIAFRNPMGRVVNIMRYYWNKDTDNKLMLPGLPTSICGFDKLAKAEKKQWVLLCEGPFDAIALDYAIGAHNRNKYVILGIPGTFKKEWAEHFRDRKVRVLYDNDDNGRTQTAQLKLLLRPVVQRLQVLNWPNDPKYRNLRDINDLVRVVYRANRKWGIVGWIEENSEEDTGDSRLVIEYGWDREDDKPEVIDWIWPDHIRCGTYVSFSGKGGTLKSTIAAEIVARYTRGQRMPSCDRIGLPAGKVICITAEDSKATLYERLKVAGADLDNVITVAATLKDDDQLNILEHIPDLRQQVQKHGVRLVILDGQNSLVGAPCIATDMLARSNVTNKLHQFAQRENICLIGIRNEDVHGRAMGPQSMGDISRCMLRAVELEPVEGDNNRYFILQFVKVSDAAPRT